MHISKQVMLDYIGVRHDEDAVARAERELPDQIDTHADAGLLEKLGVDPDDFEAEGFGGAPPPGPQPPSDDA